MGEAREVTHPCKRGAQHALRDGSAELPGTEVTNLAPPLLFPHKRMGVKKNPTRGAQELTCCCPAARGHPPGRGEESGNHLVREQSDVSLDLQQVQHQGHESTHDEEDHAPLHQVLTQVQGAAAGGAAGTGGAGAACSVTHQRQRGAGDGGAQHLAHLGGQPSSRVPTLGFVPFSGCVGTAPGAVLQPGHWLHGSPERDAKGPAVKKPNSGSGSGPPPTHHEHTPPPPPASARLRGAPSKRLAGRRRPVGTQRQRRLGLAAAGSPSRHPRGLGARAGRPPTAPVRPALPPQGRGSLPAPLPPRHRGRGPHLRGLRPPPQPVREGKQPPLRRLPPCSPPARAPRKVYKPPAAGVTLPATDLPAAGGSAGPAAPLRSAPQRNATRHRPAPTRPSGRAAPGGAGPGAGAERGSRRASPGARVQSGEGPQPIRAGRLI